MKKFLLMLSLAVAAVSLRADVYQLYWDKSKPSGSFTDETMWQTVDKDPSPDFDKGVDRFFRVEAKTGATNTVVLSDCNLRGGLNYYIWPTASLILDGRGTWFRQHSADEAETVNNSGYGPFTLRDNDYNNSAFNLKPANISTDSTISFSNSLQRFDRMASPNALKWTMESGYFSFAEPNAANAAHTLSLDCNGTDKIESSVTVEIAKEAEVVFPAVEFQCLSTNGVLVVDGGKLDVLGAFKMDASASAAGWRNYVCTNYMTVRNGGRFRQLGGKTSVGMNGNQGKRINQVTVTGAGSSYSVGPLAGAWDMISSSELAVEDGASFVFEPAKEFRLGGLDSNTGTDALKLRVAGADTKFDASKASSMLLSRRTSAVFEDGATVLLPATFYLSQSSSNDDATMTIRGADTRVLVGGANQCYFYPGFSAGKATVNMEGGYLSAVAGKDFCIRPAANANGSAEFNISGGTVEVKYAIGYSSWYVAFRGNGLLHVSGGEVKNERALYFNYETTSTSERTSRFHMTGGVVTVGESSKKEGVAMSNVNSAYRRSIVDLDGGTLVTYKISADNSVTAGKLAPADFSADGGTVVARAATDASAPFIRNIDRFKLGPKGLTVDTKTYDTYIRQAMTDKDGVDGLLVKKGLATLQLANASYRVARTRVEEGTLHLPDAEPDFTTALSIGSGATFSLEGAPTGVTLTGLAVTNGTIRLDPTDVITVRGPVGIQRLRLSFTSLPELETAEDFLVVDGALAPADARALRCAVMDSMEVQEGAHVEVLTAYDEQSGKTTVSVKYATDADPITDTVTWNGAGDDWATDGNWDGGVPTAEKKAVFPETAVKTVTVDAAAKAGAVAFAAEGYTLTGAGPLEIAGEQGAAEIASTVGAATVDVPILLDTMTALPVADGATLTFEKPILNGGIKKTGAGSLVLAASNEFERTVSLAGGLNLVKNACALGMPTIGSGRATFERGTLRFVADDSAATFETGLGLDIVGGTADVTDPAIFDVRTPTSVRNIVAAGSFFKRGAGALTLDLRGEAGVANVLTTYRSGDASSEGKPPQITPVSFDEAGKPSLADLGGFTVFEGAVDVKGDAQSPTVNLPGSFVIGYPVAGGVAADPTFTVSGARVEQGGHASGRAIHFYLGYSLGQTGTGNVNPTLRVKDGATFICNTTRIGKSIYGVTACQPTVEVTDSTLISSYILRLSEIETVKSVAKWRCRNANIGFTSSYCAINGNIDAEFCNTYVGRMYADGHAKLDPIDGNALSVDSSATGRVVFAERSQYCCRAFDNFAKLAKQLDFVFDDSEWVWKGNGQENFTLPASVYATEKFGMVMRGKGLIVRPASGYTFTTEVPFVGAGGVQNLGAGTVKFAAGTAQFTGAAYAAEGATIDFTEAGAFTAALSGPGTFRLASANGLRLALAATDDWTVAEVPTLDATALAGILTVDFGRDADHPLSDTNPKGLVIAKLAPGTTYVPTALAKVRNAGLKSKRGVLTVNANGEIVMDVIDTGLVMIVR